MSLDIVRRQGLLEPDHVMVGEHPRGLQRPFVPVGPELIAPACVDHEFNVRTHGFTGESDESLIGVLIHAAEGSPAEFECTKAAGDGRFKGLLERVAVGLEKE